VHQVCIQSDILKIWINWSLFSLWFRIWKFITTTSSSNDHSTTCSWRLWTWIRWPWTSRIV